MNKVLSDLLVSLPPYKPNPSIPFPSCGHLDKREVLFHHLFKSIHHTQPKKADVQLPRQTMGPLNQWVNSRTSFVKTLVIVPGEQRQKQDFLPHKNWKISIIEMTDFMAKPSSIFFLRIGELVSAPFLANSLPKLKTLTFRKSIFTFSI